MKSDFRKKTEKGKFNCCSYKGITIMWGQGPHTLMLDQWLLLHGLPMTNVKNISDKSHIA